MTNRRFPTWTVKRLPGGFKVIDANGPVTRLLLCPREGLAY